MGDNPRSGKIGIILMTYGSATKAENVRAYMEHIYRGKASEALIKDFEERYRLVGGSPLIEITKKQAELLEEFLNSTSADHASQNAKQYEVRAGMLHSEPFIMTAVAELKGAGVEQLRGIILSPQFSSFIMDGYSAALMKAAEESGFSKEAISVVGPWPAEPHFITLLARRVQESLGKLEKKYGRKIPVLFTTHSLPKRVVEKDPHYLEELQMTIDAVLKKIAGAKKDAGPTWRSCYQSAGHTPEEWLKPDLTDVLAEMQKDKMPAILIAPIQFLADHLEILYDLDIAAKKQCDERGIAYYRIELPNTNALFIESLAGLVRG